MDSDKKRSKRNKPASKSKPTPSCSFEAQNKETVPPKRITRSQQSKRCSTSPANKRTTPPARMVTRSKTYSTKPREQTVQPSTIMIRRIYATKPSIVEVRQPVRTTMTFPPSPKGQTMIRVEYKKNVNADTGTGRNHQANRNPPIPIARKRVRFRFGDKIIEGGIKKYSQARSYPPSPFARGRQSKKETASSTSRDRVTKLSPYWTQKYIDYLTDAFNKKMIGKIILHKYQQMAKPKVQGIETSGKSEKVLKEKIKINHPSSNIDPAGKVANTKSLPGNSGETDQSPRIWNADVSHLPPPRKKQHTYDYFLEQGCEMYSTTLPENQKNQDSPGQVRSYTPVPWVKESKAATTAAKAKDNFKFADGWKGKGPLGQSKKVMKKGGKRDSQSVSSPSVSQARYRPPTPQPDTSTLSPQDSSSPNEQSDPSQPEGSSDDEGATNV